MKNRSELGIKLEDLFVCGAHFGHKSLQAKMQPYVYGMSGDVYIINLEKTLIFIDKACEVMFNAGKNGDKILFVGTKAITKETAKNLAMKIGGFFVNEKWNAGMLTNFETTQKTINNLGKMGLQKENMTLTKKERGIIGRKVEFQNKVYDGILKMKKLPNLIVCLSGDEKQATQEGAYLNIPIISIIDTNNNPENVTYPIACNDDAETAINLIGDALTSAYLEGLENYVVKKTRSDGKSEEGFNGGERRFDGRRDFSRRMDGGRNFNKDYNRTLNTDTNNNIETSTGVTEGETKSEEGTSSSFGRRNFHSDTGRSNFKGKFSQVKSTEVEDSGVIKTVKNIESSKVEGKKPTINMEKNSKYPLKSKDNAKVIKPTGPKSSIDLI